MSKQYIKEIAILCKKGPIVINFTKGPLIFKLCELAKFIHSDKKNNVHVYYSCEDKRAYSAARIVIFRNNKDTKPYIDLIIRPRLGQGTHAWNEIKNAIIWHVLRNKRVKNIPKDLDNTYFDEIK